MAALANPDAAIGRSPYVKTKKYLKSYGRPSELEAGFFHLLLPTTDANIKFCRTTLSSALLGYPLPQVTNWEKNRDEEKFGEGATEWGNLLGTLEYLEELPSLRDEDLVAMTDARDVWFQLKPEVLIQRYRKINLQAEKRVRKILGKGIKEEAFKHDLVFAARKECSADSKEHISCYAAPESPLPESTYGPRRYDNEHDSGIEVESRPRYLHSGIAMGSARSMRNALKGAYERWQKDPKAYRSRQEIFAEMFGEQEYHRELIRSRHATSMQRLSRWWSGASSFLDNHPTPKSMQDKEASIEYGISLDYAGSLGHVVSSAQGDADWIRYSDPDTMYSTARTLNISVSGGTTIHRDIEYSRPPFWSLAPISHEADRSKEITWDTLPLYTNLRTGVTPALIVQDPEASPEELNAQWKQMWYRPHIRTKLDTVAREPVYPIASEKLSNNDREKRWWTSVVTSPADKGREGLGFLVKGVEWKRWTDVCAEDDQSDIFADGAGRWMDPKVYPPYDDVPGL
ncbi:MAG: hypothetical protein Q9163_000463 [Psora crenata]